MLQLIRSLPSCLRVVLLLLCICCPLVGSTDGALSKEGFKVVVETSVPESASVELQWASDQAGASTLQIKVRNSSRDAVRLNRIVVSFPFWRDLPGGSQIAAGGSTMFNHPALVHVLGARGIVSATYLQSRAPGGRSIVVGLLSWRTFRSRLHFWDGTIEMVAETEGRLLRPDEVLELDPIWFSPASHWQDGLFAYATQIAATNRVRRPARPAYVGWSNWDYFGSRFTPQQVIDNAETVAAMQIDANLIQVDGGWWLRCGDSEARPEFVGGMKGLANAIKVRGFVPGIHFDGSRADVDAEVVQRHPEYFLKDQHGRFIGGRPRSDGRFGRVYYDYSHPGARAHIRDLFRKARTEWGFEYFKVDFLKFSLVNWMLHAEGRTLDGTQVVRYDPGLTSVESLNLALGAMREGMGADAWFLACTAEYGTVVGHVDALRTGGDIDPTYSRFSRSVMENGGQFYQHSTLFTSDADYHVVRSRQDEDESLVANPRKTGGDMSFSLAEMWTHYVGLFGGPKISGDNLLTLRPERKDLLRRAVALPACDRWVPIDFWQKARNQDDPFEVIMGEAQGKTYLALFNWRSDLRILRLAGFKREDIDAVQVLHGAGRLESRVDDLEVTLQGHHSLVLSVAGVDVFDRLRRALELR